MNTKEAISWLILIWILFNNNGGNENMNADVKKIIESDFESTIKSKLSNPNITVAEIKDLAVAFSELTKNDWMKEIWSNNNLLINYGACNSESDPNSMYTGDIHE